MAKRVYANAGRLMKANRKQRKMILQDRGVKHIDDLVFVAATIPAIRGIVAHSSILIRSVDVDSDPGFIGLRIRARWWVAVFLPFLYRYIQRKALAALEPHRPVGVVVAACVS